MYNSNIVRHDWKVLFWLYPYRFNSNLLHKNIEFIMELHQFYLRDIFVIQIHFSVHEF